MDVQLNHDDIKLVLADPLVRGLLEGTSDGALVIDAKDRSVLAMNERARSMLGYSESEPVGCQCRRMMNSPACAMSCPLTALLEGRTDDGELDLFYRGREGDQHLHAHTRMLLLRGASGAPLAGIELFHDAREVIELRRTLRDRSSLRGLVGRSAAMQSVYELVEQVAPYDVPVLITGESGVGKERVADALQQLSDRADRPFIKLNCAALSANLVESELFGHRRGAFTGAVSDRKGRFEAAHGGTLFLDEVGELPLPVQATLLRVLQEGEVTRVGDDASHEVDVRVIAATNRPIEADVAEGRFREDLYYRLHGARIDVPPLRQRLTDVPLLAEHLLGRFEADSRKRGRSKQVLALTDAAAAELTSRRWPGNVRELENVLRLAWIRTPAGQEVDVAALSGPGGPPSPGALGSTSPAPMEPPTQSPPRTLAEMEAAAIEAAVSSSDGNLTKAARLLGIDRSTLWRKLKRSGV